MILTHNELHIRSFPNIQLIVKRQLPFYPSGFTFNNKYIAYYNKQQIMLLDTTNYK